MKMMRWIMHDSGLVGKSRDKSPFVLALVKNHMGLA